MGIHSSYKLVEIKIMILVRVHVCRLVSVQMSDRVASQQRLLVIGVCGCRGGMKLGLGLLHTIRVEALIEPVLFS